MHEASIPVRLSVSLFDSFSLRWGGRPVAIKNRKAQALLAYLILSPVRTETRERLCGLLWSESEEQKARASLRQTLHQVREILQLAGFEGFSITRDEVGLDKSNVDVDVWEVCAVGKELHPLLLDHKELPDSLLAGLEDVDEAFRSWLIVQRQLLHDKLERQLEDDLASDRAPGVVKQVASALLNLDPTHEVACRGLIQAYADQGDVASALKAYRTLWDLLDKEYDVEPAAETQALIVRIRQGAEAAPAKTRALDSVPRAPDAASRALPETRFAPELREAPRKFVMSVSPFELAGLPADKAYIVQGFRHELIACLVRFREWYVRDAGQKYADTAPAVHQGLPSYYIDASAFEADEGIRLILTLRESGSAVLIWSERYLITLANWFETQQAVVRRIAVALNVHLSAERVGRVARERDASLLVYDRWLRGQALIQNYSPPDWHRAADIFNEIITEAPGFAPAYSSLVQLYNSVHLVHPGIFRSAKREEQALELAKTAVQIDPIDSRSQLCLGWAHAMAKQYSQAEINLGLAHDLNENDPWTLNSSAQGFAYCGALDQARRFADQALKLSLIPSPGHWGYQVGTRFLCGDYDGCIEAAERAAGNTPNLPGWKAAALFHTGRMAEAADEVRHFIARMQAQWFGTEPPTEEAVTRWFLHLFPIKEKEGWERLRDGLAGAGARVGRIEHHHW